VFRLFFLSELPCGQWTEEEQGQAWRSAHSALCVVPSASRQDESKHSERESTGSFGGFGAEFLSDSVLGFGGMSAAVGEHELCRGA